MSRAMEKSHVTQWYAASAACAILFGIGNVSATDFHIAPNGNDAWSGSLAAPNADKTDGPLATPAAARDAARKAPKDSPRRVLVHAGDYFLSEPLTLDARDSGLVIEAAQGEKPVLYGGRRLTGWQKDGETFWSVKVPDAAGRKWDFRMFVVNGRFCTRARLPKTGHFTHQTDFNVPWMSTTGGGWKRKSTEQELTTLAYRPEDLPASLDVANAELTVYHMWDESVVGLKSLDPAAHTLTFSNPAGHPPGAFGVKKYVVWNVREGMSEPGQWYLDRTAGKVVYRPLPGEDMGRAEVIAPNVECIIRLQGTKEIPIKDVTLRGLSLSVTNTPLVAGGFGASRFDGAVSIAFAEKCTLSGLTVFNVGGQGIKSNNAAALHVANCEIRDCGACGLILQGNDCEASDNYIHHVGITYPSAIGLWCGGKDHLIHHNEVHDTPYTAVCGGGTGHRIESNLIHHAMKELHDGAGIYITFCKQITLRANLIRDIEDTGGYGASAYYLDEQAEECLVEGNLALRVGWPSHNHMARNNTIRNNIFIAEGDAKLSFPKSSEFRLEKNVIHATGTITFTNPAGITAFGNNVLFSGKGQVLGVAMKDYTRAGQTSLEPRDGTLLADPLLLDPRNGDCRFKPESPAVRLGIQSVNVSTAGRRSSQEK